jgi:uncharacterized protein (TIGR03435 family)
MVRTLTSALVIALLAPASLHVRAQSSPKVEFEVVSIKRNLSDQRGGGGRTLPDGTVIRTNGPISSFILAASPVPAIEAVGLPDWTITERYDLIAKPPAGSTREQRALMWQALFADRMKLVAHVEQRQRDGYAMVLAREDGRLGPQIRPSTLDCSAAARGGRPSGPPPPDTDFLNFCGARLGRDGLTTGSVSMDGLAAQLGGIVGMGRRVVVTNRTGVEGNFAVQLNYRLQPLSAGPDAQPDTPDDTADVFTAIVEQLGLKLQPEKSTVSVLVVDHIERPTEN